MENIGNNKAQFYIEDISCYLYLDLYENVLMLS